MAAAGARVVAERCRGLQGAVKAVACSQSDRETKPKKKNVSHARVEAGQLPSETKQVLWFSGWKCVCVLCPAPGRTPAPPLAPHCALRFARALLRDFCCDRADAHM